jgi:hypothetical protein
MDNLDYLTEESKDFNRDKLDELTDLCLLHKSLEKEISEIEEKLKGKQKELLEVSRNSIPSILNELMVSEIKLVSGEKVEVEEKLQASISNKNYLDAYKNMIDAEGGDELAKDKIDSLFKTQAILNESDDDTLNILIEEGISYDLKRSIHPQTLKKYCRGLLEEGKPIPNGISVFQYQETKIK